MTIGPEPSTRILVMSSRLGTLDLPDELVEQPQRVVGSRPRLRVVLHAARRYVEQPDALDRPVVEVHVGELRLPEVALQPLAGAAADREPVVLRRDRDPPVADVLDRVVGPAMPERELERLQPDRAG